MATNPSPYSVVQYGPSPNTVIINSQNDLEKVFDSLVHIGKLKHDKRHEELTALASSVIALGAYLSASEIPWPKPADGLGIVLVEILEWGQKLWLTQWYFARNPYPPKKKPDQIEDELARELDPERTALAEEIERKTIETERHTHATEQVLYSSRLNSQLRTMAQWPEKRLREIQLRGFEIIREMIDPKPTAELDAHAEKLATPSAVAAEMPTAELDSTAGEAKSRGGRPSLADSTNQKDIAKLKVYQLIRIQRKAKPNSGPKKLSEHFKDNNDFRLRLKEAGLKFGANIFRAALNWIKSNSDASQETQ